MDKLSIIQRTLIVQLYFESNCSVHSEAILEMEIITHLAVFALVSLDLRHLAQLRVDSEHPDRSKIVRLVASIESARHDVIHNPQRSVRRRSGELQISETTL